MLQAYYELTPVNSLFVNWNEFRKWIKTTHFHLDIYLSWRLKNVHSSGKCLYISISYIDKLYAFFVLHYVCADLNTNDFTDWKVSYEDAAMEISVFGGSGTISFF